MAELAVMCANQRRWDWMEAQFARRLAAVRAATGDPAMSAVLREDGTLEWAHGGATTWGEAVDQAMARRPRN